MSKVERLVDYLVEGYWSQSEDRIRKKIEELGCEVRVDYADPIHAGYLAIDRNTGAVLLRGDSLEELLHRLRVNKRSA